MKNTKKIFKIITLTFVIICSLAIISGVFFYHATTYGLSLNYEKLEQVKSASSLKIFDKNGEEINLSTENYIGIKKLSATTKNAFICAEDKRFYSHKGVDYLRMASAMLTNLKTRSFSQGASTISQQLIKNTQLSSEKTIKRKMKEIKLTKILEKKYSKDDILEMYLNNIYFGNGCYGIENASKHYFGKSAANLTTSESALLAGTINAPSVYDIENNQEKALQRRNLILKLMNSYEKITDNELIKAQNENINLSLTKISNNNYAWGEIISEACAILKKSENELKNSNIKIYTYFDSNLQNNISDIIKTNYSNLPSNPNIASIVLDNKTNGIVAIIGNKKVLNSKKQPGSLIKPILVYAPAFEQNKVSPATKILDEKININGYSPENADKKFHGYVSVRESLKKSYNIPSVKLLNEVGISYAQKVANKFGISFDELDNNLAIALGGFTQGTTLSELCDAYCTLANNGEFSKSKYISKIVSEDKTIYINKPSRTQAVSSATAYLLTDILKDASKTGTSRRLKPLNFDIASKTGTVGSSISSKNLEAFNAAYTSEHTILTYIGGSVMPESINGATYPTMLTKNILETIYANHSPANFQIPDSVTSKKINKKEYEKNIVVQTDDNINSIIEVFSKNNLPKKNENSLILNLQVFNFENKKPILCFFASPNYNYTIVRKSKNSSEVLANLNFDNINEIYKFEDKTAKSNEIYEYFVEICKKSNNSISKTNSIKLKAY